MEAKGALTADCQEIIAQYSAELARLRGALTGVVDAGTRSHPLLGRYQSKEARIAETALQRGAGEGKRE